MASVRTTEADSHENISRRAVTCAVLNSSQPHELFPENHRRVAGCASRGLELSKSHASVKCEPCDRLWRATHETHTRDSHALHARLTWMRGAGSTSSAALGSAKFCRLNRRKHSQLLLLLMWWLNGGKHDFSHEQGRHWPHSRNSSAVEAGELRTPYIWPFSRENWHSSVTIDVCRAFHGINFGARPRLFQCHTAAPMPFRWDMVWL